MLVMAARTSPPLRDAVSVVEDEVRCLRSDVETLSTALNATVEQHDRWLDLLADVADSGIEFEDPRISYVSVQVDRVTWDEVASCTATTREKREAESVHLGPEVDA